MEGKRDGMMEGKREGMMEGKREGGSKSGSLDSHTELKVMLHLPR